jgi:hypothetical protein
MSNEKQEKTEIKVEKIKEAVVNFKDNIDKLTKDISFDIDTWKFSVESQKEAVKLDVALTVTIKKKAEE